MLPVFTVFPNLDRNFSVNILCSFRLQFQGLTEGTKLQEIDMGINASKIFETMNAIFEIKAMILSSDSDFYSNLIQLYPLNYYIIKSMHR